MFQLKDFRSILASLVNLVRGSTDQLTDFNPGSITRTLLEAPAAEIEELYLQAYHGIMDAIPVALYGAFDFERRAPVAAWGYLTFSRSTPAGADIVIPAGTVARTATGTTFTTDARAKILAGETSVTTMAHCTAAGTVGNALAGLVVILGSAIQGVEAVTNPADILTGLDEETDLERKDRFREYLLTLPRGTIAALTYAAKQAERIVDGVVVERVTAARVIEPFVADPSLYAGFVRVIVAAGAARATGTLVARAQQIIDGYQDADGSWIAGYKAAGVIATVEAAKRLKIAVTTTLTLATGTDAATVQADVVAAQIAYLNTLGIGDPVRRAELIAAAMGVDGVTNAVLTVPAEDIAIPEDTLPIVGTVTTGVVA